jgi:hypothetical protein
MPRRRAVPDGGRLPLEQQRDGDDPVRETGDVYGLWRRDALWRTGVGDNAEDSGGQQDAEQGFRAERCGAAEDPRVREEAGGDDRVPGRTGP